VAAERARTSADASADAATHRANAAAARLDEALQASRAQAVADARKVEILQDQVLFRLEYRPACHRHGLCLLVQHTLTHPVRVLHCLFRKMTPSRGPESHSAVGSCAAGGFRASRRGVHAACQPAACSARGTLLSIEISRPGSATPVSWKRTPPEPQSVVQLDESRAESARDQSRVAEAMHGVEHSEAHIARQRYRFGRTAVVCRASRGMCAGPHLRDQAHASLLRQR